MTFKLEEKPQQMDEAPVSQNTADADREIFLVDGSGYIFRAYFALPQNLTNPQGMPIGAVLGFTNMLMKLLTDLHAPYIAVIFDAARKNFRNEIFADYKANRDDTPEDLKPQFPLFREATEAFGIPAIEVDGYEADDIIATYARLATDQGLKVTIVGSDKDLMQLVNDNVRLYDPIKGRYIETPDVEEKFGVPPEKVIDVQALCGDPTDNIPGVPGIGVKTAATLIHEFGTLEALLERAEEIPQPKRRQTLLDNLDQARLSKKLVTLEQFCEVPLALDALKTRDMKTTPRLKDFLKLHGFKNILARLDVAPDAAGDAEEITISGPRLPAVAKNEYTLINDLKTLKEWLSRAVETGYLAIDTETTSLNPTRAALVGISISPEPGKGAYIPVGHAYLPDLLGDPQDKIEQIALVDVIETIKPVLVDDSVLKIGHNIKYDWQILANHDIEMSPCDDTMLISYVLDNVEHGHGMDTLADLFCGHKTIKFKDVAGSGKNQITFDKVSIAEACDYASEDAEITMRLHKMLKPRLAREHCTSIYEDVERPLIPVIATMERTGIKVDALKLKAMSEDFGKRLAELEAQIHEAAGGPFNVGSPKQIGEILFDQMGLEGGKKTKTGVWSTAADTLEVLAAQGHEIVQKILDWRQLAKLKSTYTDALQNEINPDTGRVHSSFNMTGTSTGRLSSSDPNLQNIPIRSEEGRMIREAFIAEEGHLLLAVDYSQVELRLAAAMAGVEALKEAFRDGVDIHALTASRVFGVPLEEVTGELRSRAKAVNFGIIYGISGWGLAKQLGCGPGEADEFIKRYLSRFSEIQDYMEARKEEARQHGYVKTLYGRKCVIPGIGDKNMARRRGAERQAINAPLQGTAADIMKLAMIRIPPVLADKKLGAKMLLQVHDELVFEVPENEIEETAKVVKDVMESVARDRVDVPLLAEAGWAKNWAEAH